MYYALVLALAMAAGAHAEVPDYLSAYSNFNKSFTVMQKHLSFETPNAEQLSYAVLMSAITGLADAELLLNLKYDQIYELGTFIAQGLARISPQFIRELAKKNFELAQEKTAELRKIIDEKCIPSRRSSSVWRLATPTKCNEDVDQFVKKGNLQEQAKLLLALGELGYLHLTLEPELAEAAKNNKESEYLATGKEKLRAIVALTLETYKLLYFK